MTIRICACSHLHRDKATFTHKIQDNTARRPLAASLTPQFFAALLLAFVV